jgi:NAD(P)-dependent dehydrogenase (short-subunit alcohol dehydrogenase family)
VIERVVVTGAAGRIGAATVEAFQELGGEVIGIDIVADVPGDDGLQMDIGDPDCGERLLAHLDGRPVDLLVNNAALGYDRDALSATAADFDDLMAVNLRAPLLLATALHQSLSSRSGSVVNVSSVHAVSTSARASLYAASKGGLAALTRALAVEWAPEVRVNCILPGAVDTPMLSDGLIRAGVSLEDFSARQPMKRVGQPAEIADAVVFLATNTYITGSSLVIDGGVTAHLSSE